MLLRYRYCPAALLRHRLTAIPRLRRDDWVTRWREWVNIAHQAVHATSKPLKYRASPALELDLQYLPIGQADEENNSQLLCRNSGL
jgi:hypothetical protein